MPTIPIPPRAAIIDPPFSDAGYPDGRLLNRVVWREERTCLTPGQPGKAVEQEGRHRTSEREEQSGDKEIGTCHICGRTFSTQEELSKHLMDEHAGERLPEGSGDSREASSA